MGAFLRPTGVTRLPGDDHGRADGEGVADTDRGLRAIVALQCPYASTDIPRRRRPWEALIMRPTGKQPVPPDVWIDAYRIVFAVIRGGYLREIVVGTGKRIASRGRIGIPRQNISGDGIDYGVPRTLGGRDCI